MTRKDNRADPAHELRQQAEAILQQKTAQFREDEAELSPEATRQTLHDLRVHQIELEMQNEELRRAYAELDAVRTRYFDLYDLAPVGYCTLSKSGLILEANLTAATLLGVVRGALLNQPLSRFILKEDQDIYYLYRKQLFETGEPQECDLRLVKPDGAFLWVHLAGITVQADDGATVDRVVISDITEHKGAEKELRAMVERYRFVNKATNDVIWDWNVIQNSQQWNEAGIAVFGWTEIVERPVNAEWWVERVHPDDRERVHESFFAVLNCPELDVWHDEYRFRKADGAYAEVMDRGYVLRDEQGKAIRMIGAMQDITERKQAEIKLHLAASVFTYAREGIMITDPDGTILEVNDAFTRITGYSRDEALGRNPRLFSSGLHDWPFFTTLWRDLLDKGHWYGEIWDRRKDGQVYAALLTISAVRDAQSHTQQYVALFSDITTLKTHEQQLEHIAHYDVLTTLPNRMLLADRLQQALAQAERRGQPVAVALLDLDGFKTINDQHGHEAGDRLLMTVAARMKQALREGDTLARLGGDEFVAVLPDLADIQASVPWLTRLLAAAAAPVSIGDLTLQVSASIGVTFYPQMDGVEPDQLLRQADQAMYQAKLAGKNRYHVFDAQQDRDVRSHHDSVERIRRALVEHELALYYQPKVNLRTGAIIGAEALIYWRHPEKGLLSPAMFLPVIEDHPLAVEIGEWVIETALTQMETWQAVGCNLPVSVNIGARQLQQLNFVQRLSAQLAMHPAIEPSRLELEVLETSALEDLGQVSQVIAACREMGVRFALDNFGAGYSSLTYLKRLEVALLKIDRSIVRDMLDDPDDLAILQGVIGLATAFQRQVIAEGVETVEQGEMLLQLGCEQAQGYGIARPMPPEQIPAWIASWTPPGAWTHPVDPA